MFRMRKIVIGEVTVDCNGFTVSRGDEPQVLPKKEFLLYGGEVKNRCFLYCDMLSAGQILPD